MKYQYRIREQDEKFLIEAMVIKTTGILWWKKREKVWGGVNQLGEPKCQIINGQVTGDLYIIALESFDTLEGAEKQIEKFIWPDKNVKYHYPFGNNGSPFFVNVPKNPYPTPAPPHLFEDEPNQTLRWYAYHELGGDFYLKWKENKLTKEENIELINGAISHVRFMHDNRIDNTPAMRKYDDNRLQKLITLLNKSS